ncbi:MAG: cobalamin-binding protein [Chlorobiaceae bacterium]|nr:cobalamin-binding protein [Chlorobiaceae bacterium]
MRNIQRCPIALALCTLLLFITSGCTPKQAKYAEHQAGKPRIISLAPSLTEMIFAIGAGDQLVGRTNACDWPAAAARVPVIGAFGRPSLELLASIHPDLVVDVDLAEKETGKKISALGIRRESFSCKTPDDIPVVLRKLGIVTGHTREADSLALSITAGLAKFKMRAEEEAQKVKKHNTIYLEIWNDPFWTGGKGSYTSALIAYAGGENIGDVVHKEYFEISQEWVIKKNPEVIACMYMAKKSSAAIDLMQRPGWNNIAAVKNQRVYDHFDNSLFLRPGPRVLEGVEQLYRTIHASGK